MNNQRNPHHWWINGNPVQHIYPDDRGLAYGDGLFETMRVISGSVPLLKHHLARLVEGSRKLSIDISESDIPQLIQQVCGSAVGQSVCKLIVTRQGMSAGYKPVGSGANLYCRLSPLASGSFVEQSRFLTVKLCDLRLSCQPKLAGVKHLSRLEQVMAASEVGDFDEGLLLDEQGFLVEAVSSNLIFIDGKQLVFCERGAAGVDGVMSRFLTMLPECKSRSTLKRVRPEQLDSFAEILVCNSVRGVRNIGSIEGLWQGSSLETGNWLRSLLREKLGNEFYSF